MVWGDTTIQVNYQNCGSSSNCYATIGTGGPASNDLTAYSQGVQPFTYLWNTGATTQTITPTTSGNYCVTIIDANGCVDSACYFYNGSSGNCSVFVSNIPGTVILTANGNGVPPFQYSWDNGLTYTSNSSTNAVGSGTYCVIMMDATGCTSSDCFNWNPNGGCSATINAQGANPYTLTASGTGVPPLSYQWNTGATTQSITVSAAGTYCLLVTDATGCVDTACFIIQGSSNCSASVVAMTDSVTGAVSLYAMGDPALTVASYSWNNNSNASSIVPNTSGNYCVTITYTNGCVATSCYNYTTGGGSSSCSVTAYAYPDSMNTNLVYFYASPSGTAPYSYTWYFSDGTTSTLANPVHNFGMFAPGLAWAMVEVTDATGCVAYYSFNLNLFNPIPSSCQADFMPYANFNGGTPGEVMFTDFSNTANQSPAVTYAWDFGDGSTSSQQNPTHTYAATGYYYVCLTVTNLASCQSTFCTTVYVDLNWWNSNPYQGNCTAGYLVFPGPANAGMANIINISQGNNLTYTWNFGNGITATGATPFVTLSNSGAYYVCLTIEDSVSGCTDTYCDTLFVDSLGFISRSQLNGNVALRVVLAPRPMNVTGISEISSNAGFSLFPNPSNGLVSVRGIAAGSVVEVFNTHGQRVYISTALSGNAELDLSNLSDGTYHIRAISGETISNGRFIIKH
jgi:PKD repeat protein